MFRGVKVGSVTDISLKYDPKDLSMFIPVTIEIEQGRFQPISDDKERTKRSVEELIETGLKGQLKLQSVVTGQLMVNIDFIKDKPVVLVGADDEYPELPTVASDMEQLSKTLENIPFEEIFDKLSGAVEGLEKILSSHALTASIEETEKTLKEMQKLAVNIESTSDAARSTLVQAEKTLAMEEGVPGELASEIKDTLVSVNDTMKMADRTLTSLEGAVGEDSSTVYELNNTLEELTAAARSIRFLSDYLERHPEALLRGKGGPKGE
jgi:paraquat-inducible protein B